MEEKNSYNILFLFEYSPDERDLNRFNVFNYIELGYKVLILDLSTVLDGQIGDRDMANKIKKVGGFQKCTGLINTLLSIKKFSPDFTFSYVSRNHRKKYFTRITILNFAQLCSQTIEYCGPNGPHYKSKKTSFKHWTEFLFDKVAFCKLFLWDPSYSYVGGKLSLENSSGKPILGHSLDFDLFLKASRTNQKRAFEEKYLVFLDEDFVFHIDYQLLGIKPPVSPENYFSEVNFMLKSLAQKLNLKPIVQLHPTANRRISKKYYNFEISEHETAQVVQNSDLVISHDSTSLQFAVMFQKPVILLETSEMVKNKFYHTQINNFSKALSATVLTIDDFPIDKIAPKICNISYQSYKEDYIKLIGSPNRFSHEIILNSIKT